jgi:thymidylate synthase (FAD)
MGDDITTVNAARVSFNKESEWVSGESVGFPTHLFEIPEVSARDESLINYLAKHSHWTPFSHSCLTVRVKAPIFVARQLFKHKVGLTENEISRRYVSDEPEFWQPKEGFRQRAENKKQGSKEELLGENEENLAKAYYNRALEAAATAYEEMLKAGACPEQARAVLPQAMFTEWYWTGSLLAFSRVYKLRTDSHAQAETGEIAEMIGEICRKIWPVSWRALVQ